MRKTLMELTIINQILVHILLFTSCAFLIQCEAKSSGIKSLGKSRPVRHLDMLAPSDPSYSIDSPSSLLPPLCVDPPPPPLTPFPPAFLYYSPPPPPPFLYYSPPEFPPNPPTITPAPPPPLYVPAPPTFVPSPPGLAPGPPIFLPPVVYPPPRAPPPPTEGTLPGLWCVAKPTVPDRIIQEAMDYACGSGADCDSIQPNGSCYQPNTLLAHASYAFNSYWQRTKVAGGTCDFGGTAMLVTVDPSYDGCHFNLM